MSAVLSMMRRRRPVEVVGGDQLIYTPEATFANWTSRWHSASLTYVSGPPPAMHVGSASSRNFISLDDVDGVDLTNVGDVELLLKVDIRSLDVDLRIGVRGAGNDASETGLIPAIRTINGEVFVELLYYDSGNFTDTGGVDIDTIISATGEYWWRINVSGGTSATVEQTVWADGDSEPASPTATDTGSGAASGWLGVVAFGGGTASEGTILHYGIGLNGQPAPFPA